MVLPCTDEKKEAPQYLFSWNLLVGARAILNNRRALPDATQPHLKEREKDDLEGVKVPDDERQVASAEYPSAAWLRSQP